MVSQLSSKLVCQFMFQIISNLDVFIVDVDECLMGPVCENGVCINNEGSYTCSCNRGYTGVNFCEGNVLIWI